MKIRCLIVDDEPVAHSILEEYLAAITEIQITGHFYNATDARKFLEENPVDLLFLDIKMPEEDGLSLLKTLSVKPVTILVTAMLNHALEAYDLDVIDYLVKPIHPDRFRKSVDKAIEFIQFRQQGFTISDLELTSEKYISIKSGKEKIQIDTDTISHIQSVKDYMLIYTTGGKHIVRSTVTQMLDLLPVKQFVRVHKSFIVNRAHIKRIASSRVEIEGFTIPIGKMFKQSLK